MTDPHDAPHGPRDRTDDAALSPTEHWERRYASAEAIWSGSVNATLADVVRGLDALTPPGRALDLGCGEGGDAIWLAEQGWDTTGVDISTTATERARLAAIEAGLPEDRIRFVAADLTAWGEGDGPEDALAAGPFDLVCASFFHSEVDLERTEILRRFAGRIAPGGHLLILSHAAPPPWSGQEHRGHHEDLRDPDGEIAELALDPQRWQTELAQARLRRTTDPDGNPAELEDGVVLLRRRA